MSEAAGNKRSARDKAREDQAKAKAAEARRRKLFVFGMVALAVALVVGIGLAVALANKADVSDDAALPQGVESATAGVVTGTATKPVLEIYEDFQCPFCAQVEAKHGEMFRELADSGQAQVVYHPMTFLDANLGNDASERSASAAGCAQDQDRYAAYNTLVFANQPAREGDGYTDDLLVSLGEQAGIADQETFESCVRAHTYVDWANASQQGADDRGVIGSPTLYLDGERLDSTAVLQASTEDVKTAILNSGSTTASDSPTG